MIAYLIGAGVMAVGGIVELFLGVRAEQQPLENIAKPITAEEAERASRGAGGARRAKTPSAGTRERLERERAGARRCRPGPGSVTSYSPFRPPPSVEPRVDRS